VIPGIPPFLPEIGFHMLAGRLGSRVPVEAANLLHAYPVVAFPPVAHPNAWLARKFVQPSVDGLELVSIGGEGLLAVVLKSQGISLSFD
jgi:hypothetical protein